MKSEDTENDENSDNINNYIEKKDKDSEKLKDYYESYLNQNSLVGFQDFNIDENPNLKNLNLIKNKYIINKTSNHDYLNLNQKDKNIKISKEKNDIKKRKHWDNSKNLVFRLTTDKNKFEYSLSNSRSKSRSLSNENRDHKISKDSISRSYSNERNYCNSKNDDEIKKAKIIYKENFLKNNNIKDPNFIPGKRLYEQYQKKLPEKNERHKQIKDNKMADEIKKATFIPQIDKNSRMIFKRSQEKNKNKDGSFYTNNENSNNITSMSYLSNNNFHSFSNNNIKDNSMNTNNNISSKNSNANRNKSNDKVENRLIIFGKVSKSKILREKTKNSIQEANHSYHPKINEKSQIIALIRKKDRIEKAKSYIMNNTKDELNNQILNTYSDENVSNENEELHSKRNYKHNDNSHKNKNLNCSSNDSLMNSDENFSREKFFNIQNNTNKDNISVNSNNANKLKLISKNINKSNVESENTFFNMRVSPNNRNIKNKNCVSNSMRNIGNKSKNKFDNNKMTSKGKYYNKIPKMNISKSKEKIQSYIPLNKNIKRQLSNNNNFENDSPPMSQSKLKKDSYSKENNFFTSRTPNKYLGLFFIIKYLQYFFNII